MLGSWFGPYGLERSLTRTGSLFQHWAVGSLKRRWKTGPWRIIILDNDQNLVRTPMMKPAMQQANLEVQQKLWPQMIKTYNVKTMTSFWALASPERTRSGSYRLCGCRVGGRKGLGHFGPFTVRALGLTHWLCGCWCFQFQENVDRKNIPWWLFAQKITILCDLALHWPYLGKTDILCDALSELILLQKNQVSLIRS